MPESSEKKLTVNQSIAWNTWGNLLYYGIQWIITVLVARMQGYADAGIYSLCMSITNIFYALSIYGMRNYQISDLEGKYSPGNYLLSRLVTGAGAFLLCLGFVIINGYNIKTVVCVSVYMIFRFSEALFDVYSSIYQMKWRLDFVGKSMTIRSVFMFLAFIGVLKGTQSLPGAIIAMTIATLGTVLIYDRRKAHGLEVIELFRDSLKVKALLWECLPLAVYIILSTSIATVPRYFLEQFRGEEVLGIYASVAVPTVIVQLLASNIFNPMMTVFAEAIQVKKKKVFYTQLLKCMAVLAVLLVVSLIVVYFLGRWGLILLFGPSIDGYEYLLAPLIWCTVVTALIWLISGILTILRDFVSLIIGNAIAVALSIAGSVVFIKAWDMQGATYALLVGNVVGVILMIFFLLRDLRKEFAS